MVDDGLSFFLFFSVVPNIFPIFSFLVVGIERISARTRAGKAGCVLISCIAVVGRVLRFIFWPGREKVIEDGCRLRMVVFRLLVVFCPGRKGLT